MSEDIYDLVIIGGGPAGATAAAYAARAQLKTLVIDKSAAEGALAITHQIENYPGIPQAISGRELLDIMRKQAADFGATFVKGNVNAVDVQNPDVKTIFTPEADYKTKAVVIASGGMGRKASIEGEAELLGKGVSHCATCDGAFFRGKEVAVIGEGEHALEEALHLVRYASKVHLLTAKRQDPEPAHLYEMLKASGKTQLWSGVSVKKIAAGARGVDHIEMLENGAKSDLAVSGVFVYLKGNQPNLEFLSGQMSLGEEACLIVNHEMQTTIPGVFAVGDVICTRMKQAVIAAADGAKAAMAADRWINGGKVNPAKYY